MAKMKHMRKPERKLPRRSPEERVKPLAGRTGSQRPPRMPMGRDRAFRSALAEEYGVTEVPRSLQRRTAKTLENLPDVLPVRRRPVLWAVKSAATAMAVLAVSFAALLGLNTTHPRLTESLPGLGQVFAAMNGNDVTEEPSPSPTPTPQPEFNPVTVLSNGDFPGVLTIDDAWSDGRVLLLDMSISLPGDFYDEMGMDESMCLYPAALYQDSYGDNYTHFNALLMVSSNGGYCEYGSDTAPTFRSDSQGKLTARWQVDLEDLTAGDELEVNLSIPDLTNGFIIDDAAGAASYSWDSSFNTVFTLPVNASRNRIFSLHAADGPVTLRTVNYSPGMVELDVALPYLGMIGDLLPYNGIISDWPLGFFARLTCTGPDGSKFIYGTADDFPYMDSVADPELLELVDLHYTFCTTNSGVPVDPRELKGPLVLTIYELPREYGDEAAGGRVSAEFTIDLSTGRAYPSENYLSEGYEKGDPSMTTLQRIESAMNDGLILMPGSNSPEAINSGYEPLSFFVISAPVDADGRELQVRCYMDGKVVHSFNFILGGNSEYYGGYGDGYSEYFTDYFSVSGTEYLNTTVSAPYPESLAESYGYITLDRMELIDPSSGEVIIPDLQLACADAAEKLLGTSPGIAEAPMDATAQEE